MLLVGTVDLDLKSRAAADIQTVVAVVLSFPWPPDYRALGSLQPGSTQRVPAVDVQEDWGTEAAVDPVGVDSVGAYPVGERGHC